MTTKLHVGNLNYTTTEESLKAAFSANGRAVKGVTMPMDRETGRPRGFAFVEMGSEGDAAAAIADMNGRDIEGRNVTVNEARERTPQSGGGQRRDH